MNRYSSAIGIAIAVTSSFSSAQQVTSDSARASPVSCTSSTPVAFPGGHVELEVFGPPDTHASKVSFDWFAPFGQVTGNARAIWNIPSNLKPGEAGEPTEVSVTVVKTGTEVGRCTVNVLIVGKHIPAPLEERSLLSARAIIPAGQQPESGYGLYSYLLMTHPPADDAERARYAAAIEAAVTRILSAQELARYKRRSELNLISLFVRTSIETNGDLGDSSYVKKLSAEILARYDYPRAAALASSAGIDTTGGGPFLASGIGIASKADMQVVLDVSRVPPRLVGNWIGAFCSLTSEPVRRDKLTLTKFGLTMRNILASSSEATPDIAGSIASWLKIGSSLGK